MAGLSVFVIGASAVPGPWLKLCEEEGWRLSFQRDLHGLVDEISPHQVGLALMNYEILAPDAAGAVRSIKAKLPGLSLIVVSASDVGSTRTIELLESGIDDYFIFTMASGLALAKLRAHARRLLPKLGDQMRSITTPKGDLRMDLARRECSIRERGKWTSRGDLTSLELQILALLIGRPGVAVERRFMLQTLWKEKSEGVQPGTVDKHVESLRRKLGRLGSRIQTVYGVGYVYRE
jgi:DNA-binding response OmpR family regulator